jgi:hypothetical protein
MMRSFESILRLTALLCGLGLACVGQTPAPDQKADTQQASKAWMDIYGFAQLDAGYDFKQVDPNWFDVLRVTKLPSYAKQFGSDGNTYFSVRQSRFGVKAEVPTSLGTLKTIFEFELFGTGVDAGQTTFRLRHAYGELGHFGGGQYWSAFMDPDSLPSTLEYWGPPGVPLFRNVQFRWMPIMGDSRVTLAVERPGASADQGVYAGRIELQNVKPHFPSPDFTGHVRLGRKWGHVQLSGIARRIEWTDTSTGPTNISGGLWGWGFNGSSSLKLGKDSALLLNAIYGEGIENYMNDAPADVGPVPNPGNTRTPITGKAIPLIGMMAYFEHNWTSKVASTIGYSRLDMRNTSGELASDFRSGQYATANVRVTPVKNMMAGGEFQWGYRRNYADRFKVPDYRLQFSFKYSFSFRIGG